MPSRPCFMKCTTTNLFELLRRKNSYGTQGCMTVTEYATKFDRLEKFTYDEVATKASRKAKFIRGLEEYIARDVIVNAKQPGVFRTYAQVVELALAAEGAEDQIQKRNSMRRDLWKQSPSVSSGKGVDPNDRRKRPNDPPFTGLNKRFQGNQGF
uniref:Retrotransposon gag domain-containing protein n=1 Tax=Cannabis sativa TaxID=3483 RepID=A0A803Q577_CANSA